MAVWTDATALVSLRKDLALATSRYRQRSTRKDATVLYNSASETVVIGPALLVGGILTGFLSVWPVGSATRLS